MVMVMEITVMVMEVIEMVMITSRPQQMIHQGPMHMDTDTDMDILMFLLVGASTGDAGMLTEQREITAILTLHRKKMIMGIPTVGIIMATPMVQLKRTRAAQLRRSYSGPHYSVSCS